MIDFFFKRVFIIQPWTYYNTDPNNAFDPSLVPIQRNALDSLLDLFRSMIPDNLVKAAIELNLLGLITFGLGKKRFFFS